MSEQVLVLTKENPSRSRHLCP